MKLLRGLVRLLAIVAALGIGLRRPFLLELFGQETAQLFRIEAHLFSAYVHRCQKGEMVWQGMSGWKINRQIYLNIRVPVATDKTA